MTVIYAPHKKKTKKRPHKKPTQKAKVQTAKLKDRAGIIGACMLARSRMFEI